MFERTIDGRDPTRGNARIACRRVQLRMPENGLDITNIGPLLEQFCCEGVSKRMQANPLRDACGCCRLVEEAAQLAVRQMLTLPTAREQPTLPWRHAGVKACGAYLPPLSQRHKQLWRQHDMSVLAPFRLFNPADHLRAVDVTSFEPDNLAGAKSTAIAQREHHLISEAAGHGKQPLRFVGAHGERQALRLLEVVDLGRQIVPPQRDAEQELHPGHDPVAITDGETRFDQMQLEAANVVGGGCLWRALQERRKSPAAPDVAALRMMPELARGHVLDHALTQRADGGIGSHGEFLLL